jgi:predicted O-methyltransferase YrrM
LVKELKKRNIIRAWLRAIRRQFFYAKLTAVILKKRANKCKDINDIVQLHFSIFCNFPFRHFGSTIQSAQVKEEIVGLLKILVKRRPKVILEIGTANGGTLFLFSRVSSPDGEIISVDLPGGRFGGGYPEWRVPFYKSFATHKQQISLIREDSHALSTLHAIRAILEERRLDFLFIDGDHTYDGVKTDFEMYHKLVRKGGIIAFHDICPHPPETGCEVNKFWREVKKQYKCDELIKDSKQGWAGIGVVYL